MATTPLSSLSSSARDAAGAPAPPGSLPLLVIQPRRGLFRLDLKAVWEYRELLYFLAWRDVKVRYKQTAVGVAWVILQPVATMLVFTFVFGSLAQMTEEGIPYPVFAFTALLPWNYFAAALTRSGQSLVSNAHLITKVYFPRLIIPIAATLPPALDFLVGFPVLIGLLLAFGTVPTANALALPLFLLFAWLAALSVSLWLSALNVRYRDVGQALPFLVQILMFLSPVVYPVSLVPEKWRLLYSLNPMTGVIEGFRWALLGKAAPDLAAMAWSGAAALALLLGGLVFFRRMESTFADVV